MRLDPGRDPAVWLGSAREHLDTASNSTVAVRMRCFHGQRAVELALKAVLLHHNIEVPKIHTLERLALLVPGDVPAEVRDASGLTAYAVEEMYPDTFSDLGVDHASEAVDLATVVVAWATSIIEPRDT